MKAENPVINKTDQTETIELTDFEVLGAYSVNVTVESAQQSFRCAEYSWDLKSFCNKAISIRLPRNVILTISLNDLKTFQNGVFAESEKITGINIQEFKRKSISVII